MRILALTSSIFASLCAPWISTSQAAEIIWISQFETEHGHEFLEMLTVEGHNVTELIANNPSPDQVAQINAADLVIVSRKVNSADLPPATWNDTVTAPLILMSPYTARSNRWAWFDAEGVTDATPSQILANATDHPVWSGLPLVNNNSGAWHFAIDLQTSFVTDPVVNGGTLIASAGTNVVVAEWPAGTVAAGPRMMFNGGSRELTGATIGDAGKFNLTPIGQLAFLNAVHHFTGSPAEPHLYAPASVDLGDLSSVGDAVEIRIPVANLGDASALTISNVSLSGPGQNHFTVVSAPDSIGPRESAEVVLSFEALGETGSFDVSVILENDSELESIRSRSVAVAARAINLAGPQIHLTFDETEGDTFFDATGYGRHGVAVGSVSLGEPSLVGGTGSSVELSGGAGITADVSSLEALSSFTLSMWVSAEGGVEGPQTLFAKGPEAGGNPVFALLLQGQDLAWFVNSEAVFATEDAPFPLGEPQHIVAVYDSNGPEQLTLYLNGTPIASEADLPPFSDVDADFMYFGSLEGNLPFPGTLDDAQVYNTALSEEDVQSLFNNPGSVIEIEPVIPEVSPIVWISELESPAGEEFLELLNANGLPVTQVFISNPDLNDQALLNAAEVIIISRKAGSGTFNHQTWNTMIETPLILMSPYISRAANWGWFGGGGLVDETPAEIGIDAPTHPIFEDLTMDGGVAAPWHELVGRGTSLPTDPVINGGTLIASSGVNPIVAEWPAGSVAVGPRLLFCAGAREVDGAAIGEAGAFNLTEEGEIAFLNAVRYMRGLGGTPPVESTGGINIERLANGMRLILEPEKVFNIEYSSSLTPADWTEIAQEVSGQFDDTDSERVSAEAGFYRGVEQ